MFPNPFNWFSFLKKGNDLEDPDTITFFECDGNLYFDDETLTDEDIDFMRSAGMDEEE